MIDSRVSNALIIYICFRFRQDTAEVFRTEIGKLLVRILDNNKKLTDDRESLERVIRMIISETELQDSWKMLGLYHSIAEALESAENKSRMIELTVEGIIKIFTETETRFQNRLHDVLKNLDAKQLRKEINSANFGREYGVQSMPF